MIKNNRLKLVLTLSAILVIAGCSVAENTVDIAENTAKGTADVISNVTTETVDMAKETLKPTMNENNDLDKYDENGDLDRYGDPIQDHGPKVLKRMQKMKK